MNTNGQNSNGHQRSADNVQHVTCGLNIVSKGKYTDAVWAMELYERLSFRRDIHIRRIHYWALLQECLTLPSGKPYRNTITDFDYLKNAFEHARLLGLVPYDVFSDSRVSSDFPASLRYVASGGFSVKGCYNAGDSARRQLLKQMIEQACRRHMRNILARIAPVHVEVWLERTSASDLVVPLAEKYHLNIVASEGDISLTNIWRFIRRVGNASRPVRILYICDFDPQSIAAAAIDKVTAAMSQYGLSGRVDLKIEKLALDQDECEKYDLPCVPNRHATRTNPTELHALEAAAPGLLCKTLESHINQYSDQNPLKDAEKRADSSIEILMARINRIFEGNPDIYEAFEVIQTGISSN